MWICTRCQSSNEEAYQRCHSCGASRNTRRFGTGTPVITPSVADQARAFEQERVRPATGRDEPSFTSARSRAGQRRPVPEPELLRRVRCVTGRWLTAVGLTLAVLLPATLILLSFIRRDSWLSAVASLFLPDGAARELEAAVYWGLTALSALLLMLPGLGAAGLGSLLIRLTPGCKP